MTPQARRERAEQVVTRVCNWYEGHQADSQALRDELIGELLNFAAHEVEQAVAREREERIVELQEVLHDLPDKGADAAASCRIYLTALRQGACEGAGDDPKPDPLDGFRPDLSR